MRSSKSANTPQNGILNQIYTLYYSNMSGSKTNPLNPSIGTIEKVIQQRMSTIYIHL
jgi:hypothetical protein